MTSVVIMPIDSNGQSQHMYYINNFNNKAIRTVCKWQEAKTIKCEQLEVLASWVYGTS